MNILPATQNNFSAAIELLRKNNLPTEDISDTTRLFVMEEANSITGTIAIEYSGSDGLLRSLSVDPNNRDRGYGKALVSFIESYAKTLGVRSLYLLTTTADRFFLKGNYTIIARTQVPAFIKESSEFSSVCPDTAVIMKKELDQKTSLINNY